MYIFKMLLPVARCIFTISFVFTMIDLVTGLKCFECTLSEPGCVNPIENNVIIVDCLYSIFTLNPDNLQARMRGIDGDDDFRCLTTIEKNSTSRIYTRRCALNSEKNLCQLDHHGLLYEKCSLCEINYCNSSNLYETNIYLLLGLILAIKINYL